MFSFIKYKCSALLYTHYLLLCGAQFLRRSNVFTKFNYLKIDLKKHVKIYTLIALELPSPLVLYKNIRERLEEITLALFKWRFMYS